MNNPSLKERLAVCSWSLQPTDPLDLIARLREREIATPAILIVSHLNAALGARAASANVPIVEKPLLSNALVEKIREVCHCG